MDVFIKDDQMQRETIAIIPARGGSKRCPNKNIALFKGKSMAAHTIEQALEANIFDRIIVSSDDPRVLEIAGNYPVEVDNRDVSLATDNTPLIELLRSLIDKYRLDNEAVVSLLLVTGPLRNVDDLIKAYELFLSTDKNESVVSVTVNENPVEMNWKMQDGHLNPLFSENKSTRKQDFKETYRYNDALIFDLAKNFKNMDRNLFGKAPIPYIMPPERSINIDYEFQLKLVQIMGEYYQ